MATDVPATRSAWQESYARARGALAGLEPALLDRPTDNPGWTVRNLGAHIATTDSLISMASKRLAMGKNLTAIPIPGFLGNKIGNMYNARTVKHHATDQPAELVALIESEHEKAEAALNEVPADGWHRKGSIPGVGKMTLAELVATLSEHYDEHLAVLQKAAGVGA